MKYFFDKSRLAASATVGSLVIALAVAAPQAWANGASGTDDASTRALEQKMKLLEDQLRAIQNEMDQVKSRAAQEEQHVMEVEEKAAHADDLALKASRKNHMLFFRGGYANAFDGRNGVTIQSNVVPVGAQDTASTDGWYVGAGIDFGLTNDLWGLLPNTDVYGEIMFEWRKWGTAQGNALANAPTQLAGGALNPRGVTVSQFTLAASPKIKFMAGSKIRPWIIPAGLAFNVISPPSESITVLSPGVMFGAGIDYNIWKDFYIGIDSRYHLAFSDNNSNGVNIDGLTAGGYVGMGF